MSLTPEERERIYLEEKAAREQPLPPRITLPPGNEPVAPPTRAPMSQNKIALIGTLVILGGFMLYLFVIYPRMNPDAPKSPGLDYFGAPSDSGSTTSGAASTNPSADKGNESIEYKLATIDADGYIAHDDPKVAEYKNMLDALQQKYEGSRDGIANVLEVVRQALAKKGIKESLLELGWHLDESTPTSLSKSTKFADVAAAYAALRIGNR